MRKIERRRTIAHLSPGQGESLRLFDGATYSFVSRCEGYALLESTAPPGGGMPPHTHYTQDEVLYVIEGEYSFVSGDGTLTLGPGCVVSIPKGTVHAFKVGGGGTGRCLMLLTPPGPLERFFEEVGVPVRDGEAPLARDGAHPPPALETDVQKVLESARRNGIELLITSV